MAGVSQGEDFPMLCEDCLGSNPLVRMTKLPPGDKLCKISELPYQAFRWKAGPNGRYKETVISYVVAMDKNICQCCLNDMRYGLPVGVRDALLRKSGDSTAIAVPSSSVGKQVYYQQKQQELTANPNPTESFALQMANVVPSRQLDHFAHNLHAGHKHSGTLFRNLPKLCSFWLQGKCTRVARKTCPFRPCCGTFVFPEIAPDREMHKALIAKLESDGPDTIQRTLDSETRNAIASALKGNREEAIRKRVMGEDDLSKRYLGKLKASNVILKPPEDPTITTLWLGNVEDHISEQDMRTALYPYGPFVALKFARRAKCAFVEYPDRTAAEHAASMMHNAFSVHDRPISVNWAKPKVQGEDSNLQSSAGASSEAWEMPAPPGMESRSVESYALPGLPLPTLAAAAAAGAAGASSSEKKRKASELLLSELQSLEEDEDQGPWTTSEQAGKGAKRAPSSTADHRGGKAGQPRRGGAYPAQDPSRLGAKF